MTGSGANAQGQAGYWYRVAFRVTDPGMAPCGGLAMEAAMHTHTIKTTTDKLSEELDAWRVWDPGVKFILHHTGGRDWVLVLHHSEADHSAEGEEPRWNPELRNNFLARTDQELISALRQLGDKFGPLGVARVAAHMTDAEALVRLLQGDTTER